MARLAPELLGESTDLVRAFLQRGKNTDGGFRDRGGRSDLYYTVFGLDGLLALQAELPAGVGRYLRSFGGGENLDFVHLCCLARCWAALGRADAGGIRDVILQRLERHRTPDGGYHLTPGPGQGSAYGCFLALGAYQDLSARPPDEPGLVRCLAVQVRPDGSWSNRPPDPDSAGAGRAEEGSALATAAAVAVLRHFDSPVAPNTGDWLLARAHPQGGFRAAPKAPLPDLLSTATALHALASLGLSCAPRREVLVDFLDSLWTNEGGFHGHWADDHVDTEYTFYGLLALGHLVELGVSPTD